jgi:hypothetical protein
MRSPGRAIGWQFRHRHRWGLICLTLYFGVIGGIKLLVVAARSPIRLDTPESFGFVVMVPLAATFTYLLAIFSFGLSGDLAARQSIYPARLFTLPLTAGELAGWPMLLGTVAMATLWAATRLLALWPSEIEVPIGWPALLAASLLAWTQALTWTPYPIVGLRVVVTILWLAAIDAVVLLALQYHASEPFMLAFLAPHLPVAFLVARRAVAKARRGDVPDWTWSFGRPRSHPIALPHRSSRLKSAVQAHAWFEWRRHGRTLPLLIALVLGFELLLLPLARDSVALLFAILFGVLVTPVFLAAFVGATVGKANPGANDALGLSPFIATRPLSDSALIAAKLRATIWSTLAAWLLVLLATPVALRWSGTWPLVAERAGRLAATIGTPRTVALVLLVLGGFVVWTWRQLVQVMYVGLAGNRWIVRGYAALVLTAIILLGPAVQLLIDHPTLRGRVWDAVPVILALLVAIKLSLAAWIVIRLQRDRLLADRALVIGAALWCAAVLAVFGVLAWFTSTPYFPRYILLLLAILAIPLARLSAAPLALAGNRHR